MRQTMVVSVVVASLLFLAAAGWADSQSSPGQQPERPGMGPGMMGQMPMMPMMGGDMTQMMQACIQMMNQMAGMMPGMAPSQPQAPQK